VASFEWRAADPSAIMLNHAVVKVYEMLGKLTDTPEDLQNKH
jgi:hypothetical protein